MKRVLFLAFALTVQIAFMSVPTSAAEIKARPDWSGIWGAWGTENYNLSWLKGSMLSISWGDIEPEEGVFDFSKLDAQIDKAVSNNQYYLPMIYIRGMEWIYDKGVPKVYLKEQKHSHQPDYQPYFVDEDFKFYFLRVWDELQKHIAALPKEKRDRFVGFQVPLGRSGDPQPYYGQGPKEGYEQYALPWQGKGAELWTNYQIEIVQKFIALLKKNGLFDSNFYPLFNYTEEAAVHFTEMKISANRKATNVGQGYNQNGEWDQHHQEQHSIINSLQPDGSSYVHCRDEFDDVVRDQKPWFTAAPTWHYYWNCQWVLAYGVDMFMQRTITADTGYKHRAAFEFFNDHAGYKDVTCAKSAYAALRDGLDVTDAERFPESKYGELSNMQSRFDSILTEMAPFGARNDSPGCQLITSLWAYKANRIALNDACQNVWRDNYCRYLNQIEPNVTDQGYWRVGSMDDPYGRFARGFDVEGGKNALYFDLDDNFYVSSQADAKVATIRIIYFGEDRGQWELRYHAADGEMKRAMKVKSNGKAKGWIEREVVVDDALFNNGGAKGADLELVNLGGTNCRFHLVEIERK